MRFYATSPAVCEALLTNPMFPAALQSAWYVTLICSQFWHIWLCKTRSVRHGATPDSQAFASLIAQQGA
jgi:hypothetical protein